MIGGIATLSRRGGIARKDAAACHCNPAVAGEAIHVFCILTS